MSILAMSDVNQTTTTEILSEQKTTGSNKRDPLIDTVLVDRYKLLSLLGRGATTTVYKALDQRSNLAVAVKILRNDSIFNEQTISRFEQECRTLALLKHANIVSLIDSGVNELDQPFLVMEYVDGLSLQDLIAKDNGIPAKRAVDIFIQVCAALAAAHAKGVVHRDMKPANIMVTTGTNGQELVKVLDFGVAKLLVQGETFQTKTQTGEMLGTLLYMSPEQCLEQCLDARCDVYSVGCVLYETLTGSPPLVGRTAFETMNKHLTEMPKKLSKVRPDLRFPARLDELLMIAMAKDAGDRYQSISEFQDALIRISGLIDESQLVLREPEPNIELESSEQIQLFPEPVAPVATQTFANNEITSFDVNAFKDKRLVLVAICAVLGIYGPFFWAVGVVLFLSWIFSNFGGAPEPVPQALPVDWRLSKPTSDDSSRAGTIYFLAMEAKDGVPWKTIYAERMIADKITEAEVVAQKNRLIAAQGEFWKQAKSFALNSFDRLDTDHDGYLSKEELIAARQREIRVISEYGLLCFLIDNLDDILLTINSTNGSRKGVRRMDLSEYFLVLEILAKTNNSSGSRT